MALSNITLNDTIDAWRTRDNQSANALNLLETGGSSGLSPYTKSNGALLLTGNSSIVVTANGTALQVANGVLFSTDLEVGKSITLGSQSAQTGNLTVGANTYIYGKGTALYVANNVLANLNLQVTNNITTSNISTNNDVSIGGNASIVNKLSMTGTGNVVFVNVGSASINTAYLTDMHTTNAKSTRVTIYDTLDVTGITTYLANVYGTDINLSAGANSYTLNVRTNGTVFGNLNTGNTVTSNTTATGNLRVTTSANVDGTLRVTGGSNLVSTLRVTGAANLDSTLNAAGAANLGSTLNATGDTNLGSTLRVTGAANLASTLRVTGGANLDSTLRVTAAANLDSTLKVTGGANLDSTLRVTGAANLDSTLNAAGAANVGGTLRVTGGANLDSTMRVTGAANLDSTLRVAGAANVVGTIRVTGAANLDSTLNAVGAANLGSTLNAVGDTNLGAALVVTGAANLASTLRVTGGANLDSTLRVTAAANLDSTLRVAGAANVVGTIRVTDAANLESTLNVAGNTESTNFNTTGLVYANALRTVGRADISGALSAGVTTLSSGQVTGNFSVQGDFTINGNTIYNTNQMVLSVASPNQDTKFGTYRTNNSLSLANSVAQNAFVRWNETQKYWDLSTDPANNVVYQILDSGRLSSDLTNTSATIISTASAANTLNTRIASLNVYAYSAYTQANTATTNAATADQRAVTSGSYANSAYTFATTANSYFYGVNALQNTNITAVTTNTTSAYAFANTVNVYSSNAYAFANTVNAYLTGVNLTQNTNITAVTTNTTAAFAFANAVSINTSSAFAAANTKLPLAGGTITGDLAVQGNFTTSGTITYVNSTTLNIGDNIFTLNADWPSATPATENAGMEIYRGPNPAIQLLWNENLDKWTFTNDGSAFSNVGSAAAETYANSAYTHANSAYTHAISAYATANAKADYSFVTIAANGTNLVADAASDTLTITSAMANGIFVTANSTTDTLDIGLLNTGVTAGTYGDSTTVGQFTVDAKGRLTTASNVAIRAATTSVSGIVQLEDSTSSTSTTTAATPNAVKSAYVLASGKIASVSITTTAPMTGGSTGSSFTLGMPAATTSVNGYLTSTDWNTFNGKVTSVSATAPVSSTGGTTPAISLSSGYGDTQNPYASKTANYVLAAPDGTAGVPTFRAVVAADIPTLNQNTTGTASNITAYTINQSVGSSNSPTFTGLTINGAITATGDITAFYSDRRLKTNVLPIVSALDKVKTLNGITYNPNLLAASFGYNMEDKIVGLFADEVEAVQPEAVKLAPFDTDKDGNSISGANYKTVQYEKIVPLLIEAIKELTAKVNMLEEQINK